MQIVAQSYKVVADSPLDIISFEECLVSSWTGNKIILLFYVNPPSVIIGRNQNYWREVSPSCKVPVYRRSSGGGAVYHDTGNLNWALIVPRAIHSQNDELTFIAKAISELGVYARPGDRGGIFVSMGDGETKGKISGTARRFGTRNVLHHGTLLVSADIQALKASLGGIQMFEDVSIASVPARPVNLTRFVPSLSVDEVMSQISGVLSDVELKTIDLEGSWDEHSSRDDSLFKNPEDLGEGPDFCIEREDFDAFKCQFGSREWIIDRSPPFSVLVSSDMSRAVVRIEQGKIAEIQPLEAEDERSAVYAKHLHTRFSGTQFDFKVPEILEKEHVWTNMRY
ncbi:putative Lipoate--protein ligase [uncultured spirochete]|uniref:Putative Lipoate--protein ligase n=1 Tax=uncultured spirochete TaxID=156406 RepID=A0A3P3XRS6_9SPIR|nr:putative Lipoate--protein ligase [uncultured spirochete]